MRTILVVSGSGIAARYKAINGTPEELGYKRVKKGLFSGKEVYYMVPVLTEPSVDADYKDRRITSKNQKPVIPLQPLQLPKQEDQTTDRYLPILKHPSPPPSRFIVNDEEIPGVKIPKRLPMVNSFIVMVEWPLRPGDTRVEAYFIGANKRSKYWFLFERTVNDLEPYSTRYLSTRTTAMVEKGELEIEEAAILLLKCAWEFEKLNWNTGPFEFITDDGLLDIVTVDEIAEAVWFGWRRRK